MKLLKEHTSRLGAAEQFSRQLARKHETVIGERIERVCSDPEPIVWFAVTLHIPRAI